jgi:hypothetical protein
LHTPHGWMLLLMFAFFLLLSHLVVTT